MKHSSIVIVSNNAAVTGRMVSQLSKAGHSKVIPCSTANQALSLLPRVTPGIVIADINIRDLDGFQLCRIMKSRKHSAWNQIPILLFGSSCFDSRAPDLAREVGAVTFLRVPYRETELIGLVETQLEGRPAPRPTPATALALVYLEDRRLESRLRRALEPGGYGLTVVHGEEAFQTEVESGQHDLIVLDFALSGDAALKALRRMRSEATALPTIVIAARTEQGSTSEFLRAGADEYLPRTFHAENIVAACRRVLTKGEVKRSSAKVQSSEQRLRASEARYRSQSHLFHNVVENSPDGIVVCDETLTVTLLNPAAISIFGADPETEIHPPLEDLLGAPTTSKLRTFLNGDAVSRTMSDELIVSRAGIERVLSIVASRLVEGEGSPGILLIVRDTTERRELEHQLLQSQKMEAIGLLAGGVAHDFNNLLTGILGYTDLALEELEESHPMRADLLEVKKSGDRAAALTRQLLAFSRRQLLHPQVLDLNVIVANVAKMLRRLIGENIDLVTDLDPELGQVEADPGQIEQVLVNIAVNARDAMQQGGELKIETSNVDIDRPQTRMGVPVNPGPYVGLIVRDTGQGMDKETQGRIFEPFYTTKAKDRGTGLGLSTVYGIVKQSAGHIWVESEPGSGAAFHILLPRVHHAPPAAVESKPTPEEARPRPVETLLLVEDEDSVRTLARRVLSGDGYHVLEARDGAEGLRVCEQHPGSIDLLVIDVVMPQLNGPQLVERIRPLRPSMKILFMSGYTEEAILKPVLEAGTPFLHKPFTAQALSQKVRELLSSKVAEGVPSRIDARPGGKGDD